MGECFSGGFLDDLARLGGRQSTVTSARHTETASYGYEPPEGVNIDYTDAFIQGLADGHSTAEQTAAHTAAIDPFGPNPGTARGSEPIGSEHTQYFAAGGGAGLRPADFARTGIAVLWAGMPAERDGTQMNLMIERLVTMGYARDRIWLMYGGGTLAPEHEIARSQIKGVNDAVHTLGATRDNLVNLFHATFVEKSAASVPNFVFFYVGDHGGLDGEKVAKNNFGRLDSLVSH